jgi:hypothetical protein
MIKTQIQIPDELYRRAKQVAKDREISFAEVTRRGLEYITSVYPSVQDEVWELPRVNEPDAPFVTQADIAKAIDQDREAEL